MCQIPPQKKDIH